MRASDVIRGHQWSSVVIRGHRMRASDAIRGRPAFGACSSEVINGHQVSSAYVAVQRSARVTLSK